MRKNKVLKYMLCALMLFMTNFNMVFAIGNEYIKCGDNSIPAPIPPITRVIVLLLQIILPLAIIIMGSLDFLKAVIAADQDKIKKSQSQFFNRLKAGGIFFFVVVFVRFSVSLVSDNNKKENAGIMECLDCLINDESACGEVTENNPFIDISEK